MIGVMQPGGQNTTPECRVEWRLLGEVTVFVDGVERHVSGVRQRSLLAYLVLRAGQTVATDVLIAELWVDTPPKTARNSVQRFIADIRRALGEAGDRLQTTADGYRLRAPDDEIDVRRAERVIARGREALADGRANDASRTLGQALDMWQGRPFAGTGNVLYLDDVGRTLDSLRLNAFEDRFAADLELGRHAIVAAGIEPFTSAHPDRERLWGLRALALYRCGRQREALVTLRELRHRLRDDLGVEPLDEIQELERQVLNHDPVLVLDHDVDATPVIDGGAPPLLLQMPMPAHIAMARTAKLVGRAADLQFARRVTDAVRDGRPQLLTIEGQPGIGKTHLASHIAHELFDDGFGALYGSSHAELSVPYQPWGDIVGHLIEYGPGDIIADFLDRYGRDLEPVDPNLARSHGAVSGGASPVDGPTGQMMMFQAVLRLIKQVAARSPLVVVLDDLHWADESTLQLVRHVVERIDAPVLFIATWRTSDSARNESLNQMIADLQTQNVMASVELGPLDGAEVGELVQSVAASMEHAEDHVTPIDLEDLTSAVERASGGNPFYAVELLRHSREDVEGDVPLSVRRVVDQRIDRLGDQTVRLLRTASVIGREFDFDMLVAISGNEELMVLDALERAIDGALIADAPGRSDRFTFEHDLVRRTLLDSMSTARQSLTHLAVADELDKRRKVGLSISIGELAGHLIEADDPNHAGQAFDEACRAGREAAERYSPTEAIVWFEGAIEQLRHLDASWQRSHANVMVDLGIAQRGIGDEAYRTTLIEAGRLATETGDDDAVIAAACANTRGVFSSFLGVDHERIAQLEHAIEVVGTEPSIDRANLLVTLASERWDHPNHDETGALRDEALRLARRLADPDTLLNVLVRIGRWRGGAVPYDERIAMNAEVRELLGRHDIPAPLVYINALRFEQEMAIRRADGEGVRAASAAIRALAEEVPLAIILQALTLTEVMEAGLRGDVDEYDRRAEEALHLGIARGDPEAFLIYQAQFVYARVLQGRAEEVIEPAKEFIESSDGAGFKSFLAFLAAEAGDVELARTLLLAESARGFDSDTDVFSVQAVAMWAIAAAATNEREIAKVLLDLLEPHADGLVGSLNQVIEPARTVVGRLCTVLELFDRADAHFDQARRVADDFNGVWMAARVDLYRAEMLLARGESDDRRRAVALLKDVSSVGTGAGYADLVRNADELAAHADSDR